MTSKAKKKVAPARVPPTSRRPSHTERIKVFDEMVLHVRRIKVHLRSVLSLRVAMDRPEDSPREAVARRATLLANSSKYAQLEQEHHALWFNTVFPWIEVEMPETVRAMHLQGRLPSFQYGDVAFMPRCIEDLAMVRRHLEQRLRQLKRSGVRCVTPRQQLLLDCFVSTTSDRPLKCADAATKLKWATSVVTEVKAELARLGYCFASAGHRRGFYLVAEGIGP